MSDSIVYPKHPLLRKVIEYFWILDGRPSPNEGCTLIYPETNFEIILSFRAATRFVSGDHQLDLSGSFVSPIRTCYYDIYPQGRVEYLAIRFRPSAIPLINIPVTEFKNKAFHLDDVLEKRLKHLFTPVYSMESMEERIAYLEKIFLSLLLKNNYQSPPVFQHALHMMHYSLGKMPIQTVCNQIDLYPRKLERYFDQFTGVSPKMYARIVRFNFAAQRLLMTPEKGTGDLVYQAGYADQAHFIRECRLFTGRTPGELITL
jgi:AraC-like DNA-binding protein